MDKTIIGSVVERNGRERERETNKKRVGDRTRHPNQISTGVGIK